MKKSNLKQLALVLFMLASVLGMISNSHAKKSHGAAAALRADGSEQSSTSSLRLPSLASISLQQGDKPAEQVRKNIQVLKGLPDSQVIPVMKFIGASLGVNCAYCHVNTGGNWEFEKDDKPTKVTARKMMLMQFGINKDNKDMFGDTGAITCYTCHRGHSEPQVMPVLPVSAPAGEAAKAAEPLPTTDQVLEKYIQAIGGKAAYEKLKNRSMKGTQILADGTSIPLETYQASPDKVASILTTPKQGVMMSGYNGKVGWVKNQRGQRELSGVQLAQMKRAADFYGDLKLKEIYPGLEIVDREKVGDRDAYVLAAQTAPNRIEKLYFDAQTGLLLRIVTINQTLLASIPEQTDFEDYRDVDGVKLPFTYRQSYIDARDGWTRKYTEIKHNVALDDTKFNPPPPPPAVPAPK
jgi:outer membrane lipoprotein-sorting protein